MGFYRFLYTFFLVLLSVSLCAQSDDYQYRKDYLAKFDSYTTEQGLSGRKVLDIYQDRYGFIWIATDQGLNRFDGYDFRVFIHRQNDSTSISNNHITGVTEDFQGNLWVATQKGLNRFIRENESFQTLFHDQFDGNTLSSDYVRALYADSSGSLWIETVDGILNHYHIRQDSFVHYNHSKIEQPYYEYHDIYEDHQGDLWIGGRSMGPYLFLKDEERFTFFQADPKDPTRKRDNDVAAFLEDSYGNFWVTGIDGIYRFFPGEARFEKFYGTSTYDVLEDKEGYIWFATGNGVLRFDQLTLELLHYSSDQNNNKSLVANDVNCIWEDHTGNIWFGTDNGLSKYSRNKYKFAHIYHIPGNEKTIASNYITALMTDEQNNLWIGTQGYGLDRMNLENYEIRNYKKNNNSPGSLSSNYVSDLYQDKRGDIWVGLWRGIGFNKYEASKDAFVLYSHNPGNMKTDWYNDFLEDSRGTFWAGFWGADGIKEFNREEGRFESNHFNPFKNRPIDKRISAITYDQRDRLWVGCDNFNPIYHYSYHNHKMHEVPYHEAYHRCGSSGVKKMQMSPDGDLWIARSKGLIRYDHREERYHCLGMPEQADYITDMSVVYEDSMIYLNTDAGLFCFSILKQAFEPLILPGKEMVLAQANGPRCVFFATPQSIYCYRGPNADFDNLALGEMNNHINEMIYVEPDLYLGTEKGFYRFDTQTGRKQLFLKEKDNPASLIGNLVTELYHGGDGIIWIGTTHGLSRYDSRDHSFVSYQKDPLNPEGLSINTILSLEGGKEGDIWVGTSNGLCLFNERTEKFVSYNRADKHSVTSRLTSVIIEDSRKYLWVGTSNKGLNRINPLTGIIDHFRHHPGDSSSLSGDAVNCIMEDSEGNIWVGTNQGLNLFLGPEKGFERYTTSDGLPDNHIMSIQEDKNRDLWISTHNGLIQFNRQATVVAAFFESDGLQDDRFTVAHCKLPDGQLAFGGEKGITIFDPEDIIRNTIKPQLQFTAFDKFDQTVYTDFTSHKEITLKHDENFFTIYFASLDYTAPEKNQYAYKLEGVDYNWVHIKNENQASYTDIDPGTYVFKVKGSNNDGFWTTEPISLQIHIQPPFWRTSWFLVMVILILATIVILFVRLRIHGLEKEKFNMELEQKLLRSQMNPHFIFNSLTSIQNLVLGEQAQKANHYLVKFSKLLRLILTNSRTNYITLSQELQTLEHYLTLQKFRYDQSFEFHLEVDESLDIDEVWISPMLIQPFVENAIEHGFKPANYKGKLTIRYKLVKARLQVEVEDNGIGIKRSMEFKGKKVHTHQSLATKIIRERIHNLNRFRKDKIYIDIQDRDEYPEEGNGTRVILRMPYMLENEWINKLA